MRKLKINLIELGHAADLRIYPEAEDFRFVYRTASGVAWDEEAHALHAREPQRWEPAALFSQIIAAAASEYAVELAITPSTRWIGISEDLKAAILQRAPVHPELQ